MNCGNPGCAACKFFNATFPQAAGPASSPPYAIANLLPGCEKYYSGCKCKSCCDRHNAAASKPSNMMGGVAMERLLGLGFQVPSPYDPSIFFKSMDELFPLAIRPAMGPNTILPPQVCKRCNFKNDYAGPEHLQHDGTYICRSCK